MVTSQNKNVADLSKSLVDQIESHTSSSKTGPKALQPKFKPKCNDSDYTEFKNFQVNLNISQPNAPLI